MALKKLLRRNTRLFKQGSLASVQLKIRFPFSPRLPAHPPFCFLSLGFQSKTPSFHSLFHRQIQLSILISLLYYTVLHISFFSHDSISYFFLSLSKKNSFMSVSNRFLSLKVSIFLAKLVIFIAKFQSLDFTFGGSWFVFVV